MLEKMLKSLRNSLLAGVFVVLPITVTVFLIMWLVRTLGAPVTELIFVPVFGSLDSAFLDSAFGKGVMNTFSTLVVLAFITLIGYFSSFLFGRIAIGLSEAVISKIPLANTIYKTVKQIVDTFSKQKKAVFQSAVLIEFPRAGIYSVGFLTSDGRGEIQAVTGEEVVNVFVPTTPNPTSGFLMMVPASEVRHLDMSISDAMKLIVSFGAVVPAWEPKGPGGCAEGGGISSGGR